VVGNASFSPPPPGPLKEPSRQGRSRAETDESAAQITAMEGIPSRRPRTRQKVKICAQSVPIQLGSAGFSSAGYRWPKAAQVLAYTGKEARYK
jgi:hypothetical protein